MRVAGLVSAQPPPGLRPFYARDRPVTGKTISVSMFAAAMIYSCPRLELSIYSTCKRISQKLLRNVSKFLDLIYSELGTERMREIRVNMEELVLKGLEDDQDTRVVNSYPSKVPCPSSLGPSASIGGTCSRRRNQWGTQHQPWPSMPVAMVSRASGSAACTYTWHLRGR